MGFFPRSHTDMANRVARGLLIDDGLTMTGVSSLPTQAIEIAMVPVLCIQVVQTLGTSVAVALTLEGSIDGTHWGAISGTPTINTINTAYKIDVGFPFVRFVGTATGNPGDAAQILVWATAR